MTSRPSAIIVLLVASIGAIGATPTSRPATAPTTLPIVSRAEWGSTPQPLDESRRQVPRLVTLHHAGTISVRGSDPLASVRALQRFGQTEKNWPDVPYHFLIAADGRIIEGRDWHYQPESNTKYDLDGVMNIELFGNFEVQRASIEQLRSTVALIAWLKRGDCPQLDTGAIRGHKDAAGESQTVCPGLDFYRYISGGQIQAWVEQTLAGDAPLIELLPPLPNGPTTMIGDTLPAAK